MTQWIDACAKDEIDAEDVIRFDHAGKTYAITAVRTTPISRLTACARMKRSISPAAW